jgi:hypothetical protein
MLDNVPRLCANMSESGEFDCVVGSASGGDVESMSQLSIYVANQSHFTTIVFLALVPIPFTVCLCGFTPNPNCLYGERIGTLFTQDPPGL